MATDQERLYAFRECLKKLFDEYPIEGEDKLLHEMLASWRGRALYETLSVHTAHGWARNTLPDEQLDAVYALFK